MDAARSSGGPGLLAPRPGRLAFASRLALICALTTLVVQIYQTPDPALTAYVVFFLNKPDRVESLILDVVFTILITLIVGLIILLTMLVIDAPLWRVAVMSVFSVGFLFVAFASKLRPLGRNHHVDRRLWTRCARNVSLRGTRHPRAALRMALYCHSSRCIRGREPAARPPPRRLAERAIAHRLQSQPRCCADPDERTRRAFTETACARGWVRFWAG